MLARQSAEIALLCLLCFGVATAGDSGQARPPAGFDWPNWRGPTHDGISIETGWLTTWPKDGLVPLWKAEVGPGHAGVAVRDGKAYIMGREARQDIVFCFSADSGAIIWKYAYAAGESAYGRGPRATPAVDGKAVYSVSADGQAICLDVVSGQPVWTKNLCRGLNLPMPRHDFSTSPVLEGDLLLLNMGMAGLALDRKTGKAVWKSSGDSSYSSPVPFNLGDKRCVALAAATQFAVVDMANGQKIASCDRQIRDNANCADPVIVGESILLTSGYDVGTSLVEIRAGSTTVVWKGKYGCVYASPVMAAGFLYALVGAGWERADLVCVNIKDGSEKWRQKNVGSGGLIIADGKLLILARTGDLILADASPASYTELARTKVFTTGTCWNGPVLCNGRIYVRNDKGTLVCLDVRGARNTRGPEP
ncbi:MAG: PQQ-binding-like beta-propeller repeat protein [Planctomycetota bacterium]|nr:PQQ-binding-like beta-propeller repeat protein [Planctomycetota bacterium]